MSFLHSLKVVFLFFLAYETLSDESQRREFDQSHGASYFTDEKQSKNSDRQSFTFGINVILKDFGLQVDDDLDRMFTFDGHTRDSKQVSWAIKTVLSDSDATQRNDNCLH